MNSNANEPASPVHEIDAPYKGLTKREAMAMHIMAGMMSEVGVINTPFEKPARWAVEGADALLAELARTEG